MTKLLIAIGDIHGHLKALQQILESLQKQYGIFSSPGVLREGVELVFTGDYVDRGKESRAVLALIKSLQENNPESVFCLFGNHEFLALACLDFAKSLFEKKSPFGEDEYYHIYKFGPHGGNGGCTLVENYGETPKKAFETYTAEFSREGETGAWIRKLLTHKVATIGNRRVLFIHGGIPSHIQSPSGIDAYAKKVRHHVDQHTTVRNAEEKYLGNDLVGNHSVFWDRSLPRNGDGYADETLASLHMDAIVIGHTPQKKITRYGKAVFNIDVGMCPAYGENEPAAIVFSENGTKAFYARNGEQDI